ncbi:restriction endonuclease [Brevibacillus brevis]|uniref:restriction endonuclease n=1 Tax=Brevibacillus brevis TaxID=1393 RepID=UPI00165E04B0|nr:restriction endonuclease [Brevibacillus brevis]
MARRRKKGDDPISQLVGLLSLFAFGGAYYYTNSFIIGGIAFAAVMGTALWIAIAQSAKREERLRKSGIREIDTMDGLQFEQYLGLLFRSQGYKVEVTRAAGDYGADLIIQKDGKRIAVQAKRYSKNVGIEAVQQAQASIAHYKAHEAWVVSNRDYTDAARNLAASNKVRLINREKLIEMILLMNPTAKPDPKKVIAQYQSKTQICDKCGNQMVLRKGGKGEFYGCKGYPKCRNIKVAR